MNNLRTPEMDRLYSEGLDHVRSADWAAAAVVFNRLREMGATDPEIDKLLAQVQLKLEISRSDMPTGALPPINKAPAKKKLVAAGGLFACALAVVLGFIFQPRPMATMQEAPAPTARAEQAAPVSAAPARPAAAKTSDLLVRMANGQGQVEVTPNIEIILDASGSMQALISDTSKIDIAHTSLDQLVQSLPNNTNIALRSYGHRRSQDCSDLELVAPLAPLDRAAFMEKVRSVRPQNLARTPMEASIRQAAVDLQSVTSETLLILVSDGDETCDGDPAKAAADLRVSNPNVRLSVIGFDVGNAEWQQRLRAIADQGGGSYFDAADASQLAAALQRAVQITYRVIDTKGREVFAGPVGTIAEALPTGEYRVEVGGSIPLLVEKVQISGKQTTIELRERGNGYVVQVLRR
jgi:Ca-activated chloride channel homolog